MRNACIVWSIIVASCIGIVAWKVFQGVQFETNILDLLPSSEKNAVVEQSTRVFTNNISKKILFFVGSSDEKTALMAATEFVSALESSGIFESINFQIGEREEESFYHLFFSFRHQLLSPATRSMLREKDGGERLFEQLTRALYSPLSSTFSGILEKDPLLLFPEFIQSIKNSHSQYLF